MRLASCWWAEQEGVEVVKRAEVQFPQAAARRLTLDHTERCQSSFPSQSLHWSRVNLKINAPRDNAQGLRRGGNAVTCYPTEWRVMLLKKKSPGNHGCWIKGQNLTWGHLLKYGLLSKNTSEWPHLLAQRKMQGTWSYTGSSKATSGLKLIFAAKKKSLAFSI